jgi:uncharacterized protein (TIGR00297 family)
VGPITPYRFVVALLLSAVVSLLAWRGHALDRSGALAAWGVGFFTFSFGGMAGAVVLLTFFISSSVLSRLFTRRKAGVNEKFSKGSQRDWGQVLANGGLAAFLIAGTYIFDNPGWLWPAFCGALAAVNADTWATELGVLSPALPRRISNGAEVEKGASGGVTWLGYAVAIAGSGLVAGVGWLFQPQVPAGAFIMLVTLAGVFGTTVDSWLGDTVQAIYFCAHCQKETERHPLHSCGTPTYRQRGWRWLNNDRVNFFCSLSGAILAGLAWWYWFSRLSGS